MAAEAQLFHAGISSFDPRDKRDRDSPLSLSYRRVNTIFA